MATLRLRHKEKVWKNLRDLLTVWARLFGTFRYCSQPKTLKIGLSEEPRNLNIVDLLTLPF